MRGRLLARDEPQDDESFVGMFLLGDSLTRQPACAGVFRHRIDVCETADEEENLPQRSARARRRR